MSAKGYLSIPGMLAGASFASAQWKVAKFASTAGEVVIADHPDDMMNCGLMQNDPADGESADVAYSGIAYGICESTAITFGNPVSSNTTGELQITPNDEAIVIGHALETSSAVGDVIKVLVNLSWYGTT